MPVFVDPKTCVNRQPGFDAGACPYDAYIHNPLKKTWEVDANICGDCPGPCLNFCDKDALHWGDDLVDLRLVKAQVEGTMKPEEVAEARLKHKKELAEAAKRAAAEETAKQYVGVVKFAKLDTDAEPALAQGLGVQALPTTLMFYKGQLVNATEG